MIKKKTLYSTPKLIAFWRSACILHGTVFGFCLATVIYVKRTVNKYTILADSVWYRSIHFSEDKLTVASLIV